MAVKSLFFRSVYPSRRTDSGAGAELAKLISLSDRIAKGINAAGFFGVLVCCACFAQSAGFVVAADES
jgi:hypothetical protein